MFRWIGIGAASLCLCLLSSTAVLPTVSPAASFEEAAAKQESSDIRLPSRLQISSFGNRLLIVTPHPDDETIAAGGLIQQALQSKKAVQLVVVTNGDGFKKAAAKLSGASTPAPADFKRLGERRQSELLKACSMLGLSPSHIQFVGFPDGGLHRLWLDYWKPDSPYTARTGYTKSPYNQTHSPNTPYTGIDLDQVLTGLIRDYKPTDIIYPAIYDRHDDHWATQVFTQHALAAHPIRPQEWSYLVHFPEWPTGAYSPDGVQGIPAKVRNQGDWYSLSLQPQQVQTKMQALRAHQTQLRVMRRYLESFVRCNELYQKIDPPFFNGSAELSGSGHKLMLTRNAKGYKAQIQALQSDDPTTEYITHLYVSKPNNESRLDLTGLDNQVPETALKGAHHFFLASEIRKNGRTIDQTSWVLYKLPSEVSR